ncbi:MAG: DUF1223 domain-containing protein [Caulobacteraceae bacterium]|nr:DUF1223 domain-containing protein [Caulobacteraceae bacterium]
MTLIRTRPLALIASLAALIAGPALAADAAHPVVVELFQSQGCSSCPPANANLLAIVDRPDVLALSFGVTYWDQLGWKDTFAKPQFTDRQWDYARALGHANVFTPQVVVNGRADGVGAAHGDLARLIGQGERGDGGPSVTLQGDAVAIGAGRAPARGADVLLVRYDPRTVQVPIRRGENGGRTLPHRDVVRELVRLGPWTGAATRFSLPRSSDPALSTAILVQTAGAGPILAAAKG